MASFSKQRLPSPFLIKDLHLSARGRINSPSIPPSARKKEAFFLSPQPTPSGPEMRLQGATLKSNSTAKVNLPHEKINRYRAGKFINLIGSC